MLLRLSLVGMFIATGSLAQAQAPQAPASDPTPEQAIIETIRSYVDAYNRRDVDAVADHWAENAVMLERSILKKRSLGVMPSATILPDSLRQIPSHSWR